MSYTQLDQVYCSFQNFNARTPNLFVPAELTVIYYFPFKVTLEIENKIRRRTVASVIAPLHELCPKPGSYRPSISRLAYIMYTIPICPPRTTFLIVHNPLL